MPPLGKFDGFFFFWHVLTISIAFAVEFAPASTLEMFKLGPLDASTWLPHDLQQPFQHCSTCLKHPQSIRLAT